MYIQIIKYTIYVNECGHNFCVLYKVNGESYNMQFGAEELADKAYNFKKVIKQNHKEYGYKV